VESLKQYSSKNENDDSNDSNDNDDTSSKNMLTYLEKTNGGNVVGNDNWGILNIVTQHQDTNYLGWCLDHDELQSKNVTANDSDTPVCGNGIVETGEECDSKEAPCCDSQTCKFRSVDTMCRPLRHPTCDAPDFCSGDSENCPTDTFARPGERCWNFFDNTVIQDSENNDNAQSIAGTGNIYNYVSDYTSKYNLYTDGSSRLNLMGAGDFHHYHLAGGETVTSYVHQHDSENHDESTHIHNSNSLNNATLDGGMKIDLLKTILKDTLMVFEGRCLEGMCKSIEQTCVFDAQSQFEYTFLAPADGEESQKKIASLQPTLRMGSSLDGESCRTYNDECSELVCKVDHWYLNEKNGYKHHNDCWSGFVMSDYQSSVAVPDGIACRHVSDRNWERTGVCLERKCVKWEQNTEGRRYFKSSHLGNSNSESSGNSTGVADIPSTITGVANETGNESNSDTPTTALTCGNGNVEMGEECDCGPGHLSVKLSEKYFVANASSVTDLSDSPKDEEDKENQPSKTMLFHSKSQLATHFESLKKLLEVDSNINDVFNMVTNITNLNEKYNAPSSSMNGTNTIIQTPNKEDPCCDCEKCKLKAGKKCSPTNFGCCDAETCSPKPKGSICREAYSSQSQNVCDRKEVCDGKSALCPSDRGMENLEAEDLESVANTLKCIALDSEVKSGNQEQAGEKTSTCYRKECLPSKSEQCSRDGYIVSSRNFEISDLSSQNATLEDIFYSTETKAMAEKNKYCEVKICDVTEDNMIFTKSYHDASTSEFLVTNDAVRKNPNRNRNGIPNRSGGGETGSKTKFAFKHEHSFLDGTILLDAPKIGQSVFSYNADFSVKVNPLMEENLESNDPKSESTTAMCENGKSRPLELQCEEKGRHYADGDLLKCMPCDIACFRCNGPGVHECCENEVNWDVLLGDSNYQSNQGKNDQEQNNLSNFDFSAPCAASSGGREEYKPKTTSTTTTTTSTSSDKDVLTMTFSPGDYDFSFTGQFSGLEPFFPETFPQKDADIDNVNTGVLGDTPHMDAPPTKIVEEEESNLENNIEFRLSVRDAVWNAILESSKMIANSEEADSKHAEAVKSGISKSDVVVDSIVVTKVKTTSSSGDHKNGDTRLLDSSVSLPSESSQRLMRRADSWRVESSRGESSPRAESLWGDKLEENENRQSLEERQLEERQLEERQLKPASPTTFLLHLLFQIYCATSEEAMGIRDFISVNSGNAQSSSPFFLLQEMNAQFIERKETFGIAEFDNLIMSSLQEFRSSKLKVVTNLTAFDSYIDPNSIGTNDTNVTNITIIDIPGDIIEVVTYEEEDPGIWTGTTLILLAVATCCCFSVCVARRHFYLGEHMVKAEEHILEELAELGEDPNTIEIVHVIETSDNLGSPREFARTETSNLDSEFRHDSTAIPQERRSSEFNDNNQENFSKDSTTQAGFTQHSKSFARSESAIIRAQSGLSTTVNQSKHMMRSFKKEIKNTVRDNIALSRKGRLSMKTLQSHQVEITGEGVVRATVKIEASQSGIQSGISQSKISQKSSKSLSPKTAASLSPKTGSIRTLSYNSENMSGSSNSEKSDNNVGISTKDITLITQKSSSTMLRSILQQSRSPTHKSLMKRVSTMNMSSKSIPEDREINLDEDDDDVERTISNLKQTMPESWKQSVKITKSLHEITTERKIKSQWKKEKQVGMDSQFIAQSSKILTNPSGLGTPSGVTTPSGLGSDAQSSKILGVSGLGVSGVSHTVTDTMAVATGMARTEVNEKHLLKTRSREIIKGRTQHSKESGSKGSKESKTISGIDEEEEEGGDSREEMSQEDGASKGDHEEEEDQENYDEEEEDENHEEEEEAHEEEEGANDAGHVSGEAIRLDFIGGDEERNIETKDSESGSIPNDENLNRPTTPVPMQLSPLRMSMKKV